MRKTNTEANCKQIRCFPSLVGRRRRRHGLTTRLRAVTSTRSVVPCFSVSDAHGTLSVIPNTNEHTFAFFLLCNLHSHLPMGEIGIGDQSPMISGNNRRLGPHQVLKHLMGSRGQKIAGVSSPTLSGVLDATGISNGTNKFHIIHKTVNLLRTTMLSRWHSCSMYVRTTVHHIHRPGSKSHSNRTRQGQ